MWCSAAQVILVHAREPRFLAVMLGLLVRVSVSLSVYARGSAYGRV